MIFKKNINLLVFLLTFLLIIPVSATEEPLDVFNVPAFGPDDTGTSVYSSIVLENDVMYRIVVSGTYQFKLGVDWSYADAQYRMGAGKKYTQEFNSIEFDGVLVSAEIYDIDNHTHTFYLIGNGDEVRFSIYDTYVTGERGDYSNNVGSLKVEIFREPTLSVTKSPSSPYIEQGQTTTITVTITNTWTDNINDITVSDSIPSGFTLISGDLQEKYDMIKPKESRSFQYIIQSSESGTFNLESAEATFLIGTGRYHSSQSNISMIFVAPSSEKTIKSTQISNASVQLHGEKTDVELNEDILLRLSAVNLITKPVMHVQVIILPPSGMSVTSAVFVQSGAGQFTTTYELEPGKGRDIEVRIKSNQIGEFEVQGRIIYYFGDEREQSEDYTLTLPIKVTEEAARTVPTVTPDEPSNNNWVMGLVVLLTAGGLLVLIKVRQP